MNKTEAIERIKARFDKWALDNEDTKAIQALIPELKESEDERTRKEIVDFIRWAIDRGSITKEQRERSDTWLAYLEKQKEQKPAEWSEEDEKKIHFLSRLIEFQVKNDEYCFSEGRFVSKKEAIKMLKSLRPSWKPSEEQMYILNCVATILLNHDGIVEKEAAKRLQSLYEQLKKL